jgi:hypothetical protein
MNSQEFTLLRLFQQNKTGDFNARLTDYKEFVSTLIELTDSLYTAKVKMEYWKQYFEIQLVKFSLHSSSLAYLLEGTPIKMDKNKNLIKYPDLGSIFLLCRAQIENYLMFYYLNIQPQTFEEGEFRYLLYELSGLTHRQKFDTGAEEQILKKEKEKQEIEVILDKIKNNKYFQTLPLDKQKFLLSTRPSRVMGWEKLIESSHLDTGFFLGVWKLYSNYSHSEMIGSIQIKGYAEKPEELNRTLFSTLNQSNMLTCIAIKDLVTNFKSSEIIFNALPIELITKIEFWWRVGTGQNSKK